MKNKFIASFLLLAALMIFVSCKDDGQSVNYTFDGNRYTIEGYDADHMSYLLVGQADSAQLYMANPRFLGEGFQSSRFEGGANWWQDTQQLSITFTKQAEGVAAGALTGPNFHYTYDTTTGDILNFESTPYEGQELMLDEQQMQDVASQVYKIILDIEEYISN